MSRNTALDAIHVHDQLNPLLRRVEVLVDLARSTDYSSDERQGVLHDFLVEEVTHLRNALETLCAEKGGN